MPDRYRHNKGSVTSIRYHVIWIPQRRKALVGDVAKRLIALLLEKAAEIDVTIMHLAVEPDHIHLFLDCPQHLAISQIVFSIEGLYIAYFEKRIRASSPDAEHVDDELFRLDRRRGF